MSQSAMPATQNDMTTCVETFERRGFAASPIDTATCLENQRHFRHVIKEVGMSQSATPATQNDMTTCLETFEKERFCSCPDRHRRSHRKTGDSKRDTLEHQNEHFVRDFLQFSHFETCRKDMFCSFPHRHGEATIKPMTRDETGGSTKTSISRETSSNFDTLQPQNRRFPTSFRGTSTFATSKSMFRARLPSIFSTSHKMPRLPRHLHLVAT